MSSSGWYKNIEDSSQIGGKASNLQKLQDIGVNVPKWFAVPANIMLEQLPENPDPNNLEDYFRKLEVPADLLTYIARFFGENHAETSYAVRSSALDEDGIQSSFAGQFETFLDVPFPEIQNRIRDIWFSVISDRVLSYRKEQNLPLQLGIAVIIQEMIPSEVSGVGFGIDPVSGDSNTQIISAVYGLGEGLVSGELDADTYTVKPEEVQKSIASKTHGFYRKKSGKGIEKREIEASRHNLEALSAYQIREVASMLKKLNQHFDHPQDIEFAWYQDQLYMLQTRPVTASGVQREGEYILWDNSNIVESYPGITTPLTFSFIIKMYEMVYKQFVRLLGVNDREIEQHSEVFEQTLGLVRGRVYYNLLSWYKMLAMVPGYSINARFMEKMMGVKERFELDESYRMSKGLARFRIVTMLVKMVHLHRKLPKERDRFIRQLNSIMEHYKSMNFSGMEPKEIIRSYKQFESTLLLKWKAPLINDFFAMIWFGIFEKLATKYSGGEANIHNDLLCGSQDIISVEPIHRTFEITRAIQQNKEAEELFRNSKPEDVRKALEDDRFSDIKKGIDDYIGRFGERCIGELKLETISYSQNPLLFIQVIQSYIRQGVVQQSSGADIETELRRKAEQKMKEVLKGKPIKRWWFNYAKNKARDLVSNRENLRFERTRGFGMVRTMFSALGEQWHTDGLIQDPRDIFYLELNEIKEAGSTGFQKEWSGKIEARKEEFANYKKQKPPEERFYTYGNDFRDEYIYSIEKIEAGEEDLKGIGCCPGIVQGKVQVILDPTEIESLNGDILVTSSTDPGWVVLFPTASAIIVERGSLLSHSAIVSREMGIPCIVSVTGLLRTLKTGDEVIMNGSTGDIKLVQ